jgi:hypothetical protein
MILFGKNNMALKESFRVFVEEGVNGFEDFLKKIFEKENSRKKIDEIFTKLRSWIGLKTKQDLGDLKQDVVGEASENLKNKKEENTLIFGDSIGVGFSVASKKYGKLYEKFVKSGASSRQVFEFLKKSSADFNGKSVVIMSGFNDLPGGRSGADRALKNVRRSIELAKKRGGKPVVCSLYEVDYDRINNEDVRYYNNQLKKIAKEVGVDYVDLETQVKGQSQPDGLHMNVKGYGVAWEEIRKYI